MIGIPQELRPPSLLWLGDLCQAAQDLRKNCCQFDDKTDLRVLDVWRKEAEDLLVGGEDNGCAVIMICLSELYREYGKLHSALECSEEAEQHFCCYDEIRHRHNHAVALYSVGLAHQFMNSRRDAVERYDQALAEFKDAREQWILNREAKWRRRCEVAIRWIGTLRSRLSDARARGEPPSRIQVAVPILAQIAAGEPMLAREDFDEWVQVDLKVADHVNFALRVNGDSMIGAGISPGDLALIEQNQSEPPNGTIVAILIDQIIEEATLKRFYREKDHIRLEPANASYPFIILKPHSVSETSIHEHYLRSHPKRLVQVYSGVKPRILGRVRSVLSQRRTGKLSP